ncbi:hypothetical protein D3C80_1069550 [compost metagenome]
MPNILSTASAPIRAGKLTGTASLNTMASSAVTTPNREKSVALNQRRLAIRVAIQRQRAIMNTSCCRECRPLWKAAVIHKLCLQNLHRLGPSGVGLVKQDYLAHVAVSVRHWRCLYVVSLQSRPEWDNRRPHAFCDHDVDSIQRIQITEDIGLQVIVIQVLLGNLPTPGM